MFLRLRHLLLQVRKTRIEQIKSLQLLNDMTSCTVAVHEYIRPSGVKLVIDGHRLPHHGVLHVGDSFSVNAAKHMFDFKNNDDSNRVE